MPVVSQLSMASQPRYDGAMSDSNDSSSQSQSSMSLSAQSRQTGLSGLVASRKIASLPSRERVAAAVAMVRSRQASQSSEPGGANHHRIKDVKQLKQFKKKKTSSSTTSASPTARGELSDLSMSSTMTSSNASSLVKRPKLQISTGNIRSRTADYNNMTSQGRSPLAPKEQAPNSPKEQTSKALPPSSAKPSFSAEKNDTSEQSGSFFQNYFASRSEVKATSSSSALPNLPSMTDNSFDDKDQENTSQSQIQSQIQSQSQMSAMSALTALSGHTKKSGNSKSPISVATKKSDNSYNNSSSNNSKQLAGVVKSASSHGSMWNSTGSSIPAGPSMSADSEEDIDMGIVDSATLLNVTQYLDTLERERKPKESKRKSVTNRTQLDPVEEARRETSPRSADEYEEEEEEADDEDEDEEEEPEVNPETLAGIAAFIDAVFKNPTVDSSSQPQLITNVFSDDDSSVASDIPDDTKLSVLGFLDRLEEMKNAPHQSFIKEETRKVDAPPASESSDDVILTMSDSMEDQLHNSVKETPIYEKLRALPHAGADPPAYVPFNKNRAKADPSGEKDWPAAAFQMRETDIAPSYSAESLDSGSTYANTEMASPKIAPPMPEMSLKNIAPKKMPPMPEMRMISSNASTQASINSSASDTFADDRVSQSRKTLSSVAENGHAIYLADSKEVGKHFMNPRIELSPVPEIMSSSMEEPVSSTEDPFSLIQGPEETPSDVAEESPLSPKEDTEEAKTEAALESVPAQTNAKDVETVPSVPIEKSTEKVLDDSIETKDESSEPLKTKSSEKNSESSSLLHSYADKMSSDESPEVKEKDSLGEVDRYEGLDTFGEEPAEIEVGQSVITEAKAGDARSSTYSDIRNIASAETEKIGTLSRLEKPVGTPNRKEVVANEDDECVEVSFEVMDLAKGKSEPIATVPGSRSCTASNIEPMQQSQRSVADPDGDKEVEHSGYIEDTRVPVDPPGEDEEPKEAEKTEVVEITKPEVHRREMQATYSDDLIAKNRSEDSVDTFRDKPSLLNILSSASDTATPWKPSESDKTSTPAADEDFIHAFLTAGSSVCSTSSRDAVEVNLEAFRRGHVDDIDKDSFLTDFKVDADTAAITYQVDYKEDAEVFLEQFASLGVEERADPIGKKLLPNVNKTAKDPPASKKTIPRPSELSSPTKIVKFFSSLKPSENASSEEINKVKRFQKLIAPVIQGERPSIIEVAQIRQAARLANVQVDVVDEYLEYACGQKTETRIAPSPSTEDNGDSANFNEDQAIAAFLSDFEAEVEEEVEEEWWKTTPVTPQLKKKAIDPSEQILGDDDSSEGNSSEHVPVDDDSSEGIGWDDSSAIDEAEATNDVNNVIDLTSTDEVELSKRNEERRKEVHGLPTKPARKDADTPKRAGRTRDLPTSKHNRPMSFDMVKSTSFAFDNREREEKIAWVRKNIMARYQPSWEKHKRWLAPTNSSASLDPKDINGVAAAEKLRQFSYGRSLFPVVRPWRITYKERTNQHQGYFKVDVYSIYETSMVDHGEAHPLDHTPWEHRGVKQNFLHETSIGFSRNWFGGCTKVRANDKWKPPVCQPKSMEMPIENIPDPGEWNEAWYTTWKSPDARPQFGGSHSSDYESYTDGGTADDGTSTDGGGSCTDNSSRVNKSPMSNDSDEDSWEEAPECGTIVNVKLKIGERISRVHPDYTSSLRRSRWRKKYFPRGTFPY
jgi:hypothetical protein